jgi:hypothetical protein
VPTRLPSGFGFCLAAALILTGCSGATSAVRAPAPLRLVLLRTVLLRTVDLRGTGWTVSAHGDDDVNGRCDNIEPLGRAGWAGVEFGQPGDPPALLSEEVSSAVDATAGKTTYASTIATFQKCSAGGGSHSSAGSSVTVLDATAPKVGDESRGFSIAIDDPPSPTASTDSGPDGYVLLSVSIVRDGRLVEVYVYSGGVEFEAFESSVATGVSRAHRLR